MREHSRDKGRLEDIVFYANNVKVKVKLKKNVQNVKAVERNIYNHNETTRIHN